MTTMKKTRTFIAAALLPLALSTLTAKAAQPGQQKPNAQVEQAAKNETAGQRNALRKAKQMLGVMPFSRKGLIEQLEYEGFTDREATYGADSTQADWTEQAAKTAKQMLSVMPFSRKGLIEQLEYEGFTDREATHGTDSAKADWTEQAAKKAKQMLSIMPFSRKGLIEQLEYEGFTNREAAYGASAAGL
jgi:hypothetical protein